MENFNVIEIMENNGIGKITIDTVEIKGVSKYEIKRDTDIVNLTINLSVPVKNLKTTVYP